MAQRLRPVARARRRSGKREGRRVARLRQRDQLLENVPCLLACASEPVPICHRRHRARPRRQSAGGLEFADRSGEVAGPQIRQAKNVSRHREVRLGRPYRDIDVLPAKRLRRKTWTTGHTRRGRSEVPMSIQPQRSIGLAGAIAVTVTTAALAQSERAQSTVGTPTTTSTTPSVPSSSTPSSSTPTESTRPADAVSRPNAPSTPPGASTPSAVEVPRSVAPDAGTPPAARAAPNCGAADQPRANPPVSSYPGVSADQFQRPGVPADAFVRPGVSAAQAGAKLPGTPGAPCAPARDVVLYPEATPPRRSPPPQE